MIARIAWHEQYPGMERFLKRLGVPDRCLELAKDVVKHCPQCNAFKPIAHRPKFGAELAGHFGDVMMVDLFFIWKMTFLLMIDEATRFKVSTPLPAKDAKTIARAMLKDWFRFFGPPKAIRSDQEGGLKSEDFGIVCDRYSIHRQFGGSDDSGKHTTTGLPERHILLVKLAALKCERQC